jgi:protein phosphatase
MMTSPDQTRLVAKRGVLVVVCDGIGGEDGGAIASEVAASTAMRVFYACDTEDDEVAIREALQAANAAVGEAAVDYQLTRMGTTIVMAAVTANQVTVGYVGDSRAYLYRPGIGLHQLTNDHVEEGKTGLARSLGVIGRTDGDVVRAAFGPGERLLLCTDGLYRAVPQNAITNCLSVNRTVEAMSHDLVAVAYANNSRDNITAAIVACDDATTRTQSALHAIRGRIVRRRNEHE